jgi:hypothetical protein
VLVSISATIPGVWNLANKVKLQMLVLTSVEGPYAFSASVLGKAGECDAKYVVEGKTKLGGVARYCNDPRLSPATSGRGKPKANAIFVQKPKRQFTWGIKVLPCVEIKPGDEIFLNYGHKYQRWVNKGDQVWK